jgi:hypothetical protein
LAPRTISAELPPISPAVGLVCSSAMRNLKLPPETQFIHKPCRPHTQRQQDTLVRDGDIVYSCL